MNPTDIKHIGTKKWQVVRMIGQGGMSWVFEVLDPRLGVPRALKMLKPAAASTAGYKSFWREAEILAKQEDDFLVRIYDLDKDPETGNDYYVMELLSGSDLKQYLKTNGPLDPETAKAIFSGVLQALGKLHSHSPPIIHRDIKPGNIQITASGRAKLLDLGIAKVTRRSADETVFGDDSTIADMFKGTVLYASPEHLAMQEPGPQSDVFAIGLCLYESIEGHHAYSNIEGLPDPTNSHVLYQDVFRFYTRLEAKDGKLSVEFKRTPKDLQGVIRKALELDPRRRFRDANEMRAALLDPSLVGSRPTVEERVPPRPQVPSKPTPRREAEPAARGAPSSSARQARPPWLTAAAGVALVACLAGAAYLLWPSQPKSELPPEPRATVPASPARGRDDAGSAVAATAPSLNAVAQPVANEAAPDGGMPPAIRTAAEVAVARSDAEAVKAELNARDAWRRGVESQAASQHDAAFGAYTQARAEAQRALDEARRLQASAAQAQQARCAAGASTAPACKSGEAAFARGALALQSLDARAAASAFAAAQGNFDAATPPLTVSVEPAGPVELDVGAARQFVARTSPPGAKVVFYVQAPGSTKPEGVLTQNNTLRFQRTTPGVYQITVRATDAERESAPVSIAVRVRKKETANHAPELALVPSGTVEAPLGVPFEVRAIPTDVDGGRPSVRVAASSKPKDAPNIPRMLQESGSERFLRFTPTVPGTYIFAFVASDAQGADSARKTLTVIAKAQESAAPVRVETPERPERAPPTPQQSPLSAKVERFFAEFERAFELRSIEGVGDMYAIRDRNVEKLVEDALDEGLSIAATTRLLAEPDRLSLTGRVTARVRLEVKASGPGRSASIYNGVYMVTLKEFADGYTIEKLSKVAD